MKVEFRKVNGVLVFDADGTPEEMALFAMLAGFSMVGGVSFIRGPQGPKGDAGPAGPAGPQGAPGYAGYPVSVPSIFLPNQGGGACSCPPGSLCANSACPRRMTVTCSTATGGGASGPTELR